MAEEFLTRNECSRIISESEQPSAAMVDSPRSTPEGGEQDIQVPGGERPSQLEEASGDPCPSTSNSEGGTKDGLDARALYFSSGRRDCPRGDCEEVSCLRCKLAGLFGEECDQGTLCHEIFSPASPGHYPSAYGRCLELANTSPLQQGIKFGTWAISVHKQCGDDGITDRSHVHVIHRCHTYSSSHKLCRCGSIRGWRPLMFDFRKRYYLEVNKRHVETLLLYLSKEGRELVEIHTTGKYWTKCSDSESNTAPGCGRGTEGSNGCERACGGEGTRNILGYEPDWKDEESDDVQPCYGKRKSSTESMEPGEKAAAKILEWFPASLSGLRKLPLFRKYFKAYYWNQKFFDNVMPIAWDHSVLEWNKFSLAKIIAIRAKSPESFLLDHHLDYYAPRYSAELLARLLLEQYHTPEAARDFIRQVIQITDKEVPKINTLLIISPPSAGKTFLINSLITLLWNTGQIRNSKKGGDTFTYQDGNNKRANVWNECALCGKEAVETAKQVWEGFAVSINVKFAKGQTLERTPLFVTCNQVPWSMVPGEKPAFLDRCFSHTWTTQRWLKNVCFYPSPLGWKNLLKHFEDIGWWEKIPGVAYFDDRAAIGETRMFHDWLKEKEMRKLTESLL